MRPLIDYGSVVWGTTSASNLDRISKLQKRAARVILHADLKTPSAEMFETLRWLPLIKRLNYNKAVFTYKAINDLAPQYIIQLFHACLVNSQNYATKCRGQLNALLPEAARPRAIVH